MLFTAFFMASVSLSPDFAILQKQFIITGTRAFDMRRKYLKVSRLSSSRHEVQNGCKSLINNAENRLQLQREIN